ncbi:MAG: HAD family hydrolase [Thermoleophilia bacterium]|nr:HAD family hydrolase [Thermoleophilia bacterium]
MRLIIPGRRTYEIEHVVFDLNGTLGRDGALWNGVSERIERLKDIVHLAIVTADTHGGASHIGEALGIDTIILEPGIQAEQKRDLVSQLGADRTVTIGNGANDVLMLQESAIGICVVGPEGACGAALVAADVVVTDICLALDLLLHPRRIAATLRA